MPGRAENRMSEKGMAKGHGKSPAESVKGIEGEGKANRDMVGSSDANGIRFPVHNHPDKSVVRPGGA